MGSYQMRTWELERQHGDIWQSWKTQDKQFFKAVRKFYVETTKKMLKKFPFDDRLMKDLEILQTPGYSVNEVLSMQKIMA